MGSADDGKRDESERPDPQPQDQAGSAFGPPVSEFGPPLTEFGPPLKDFGPPTAGGPVGWKPADAPERPTLGWQPADAPAAPVPPPQYRTPDPGVPGPPRAPEPPYRAPDVGAPGPARAPESPYRAPDSSVPGSAHAPTSQYRAPDASTPGPARAPESPYRAPDSTPAPAEGRGPGTDTWWKSAPEGYPPTPPKSAQAPARSSGSLWDDDELAKKLVAARPTPTEPEPSPEEPERKTGLLVGGLAAALAVIVAVVLVIVFVNRGRDEDDPQPGPTAAPPTTSATNCPASSSGNVTIGNGPGNTDSGAGAILGFQHAYYVDRSGEKVRSFVAPDSDRVPAADSLQQVIDTNIPQGTRFCLRTEQLAADRYTVELSEFRPDGTRTLYRQLVTTVNQGGRNLVWGIVPL
ncbi:hypothetical protein NDR87_30230 [Nocardia sp. CDC159]|uniref:DUF8176 domain-containing protein n=1 Tax=Nocardia pulmonis TaxID=2951408 RepID=A0A9X2ECE3_9NOCA|nr:MULTISPECIES: hypothetical protein [Nocardia]MCM6777771.1 hypothetical protein [Nocardia pulmonis]MCM6790656.1 hypothetical protein [Nocardia sp. CDC159]